jgi:hypothetical protein
MKIDPSMHIGLHLVFFGKTGVTLPSGCVGRSEDMHCIAPFAIHHEALLWSIYFNLLLEVMWCIFYYSDS